jgi:hypothetical protein
MKKVIWLAGLLVVVGACGGSPSAPTVALAPLHIGVDVSTCFLVARVSVSIDGALVATITPGDGGTTRQVTVGAHTISGIGALNNGQLSTQWSPTIVNVSTGGYNATLYCAAGRGFVLKGE